MSSDPLQFEMGGTTIVVRREPDAWLAERIGQDPGDERPRQFRIPAWVTSEELPRFLATVFDAPEDPGLPDVRRVS